MPNEQIGLIIWGCKGGHRVFCSNDVVDHREPVIKDTLKDIRSFVRFNQNKINSFALEFTDRYKIYTVYRSCNDNGTGAYVAIIVYVPHAIRIANIRQVLTKMMDKYFEEYVHPLYGTYIPGKYDDIKPFSAMLAAEAQVTSEQRRARVMPSTQDNTPNVRLYTDIAEVDEFFGSPYRPEFFACQEVMFLDKSIYDKIPDTLQFQMPPRIIERVSPPEPLPAIELGSYAKDAKVFTVNGQPQNTAGKVEVNDFDKIELVFTKPYHDDFVLRGTVSELIANRLLNEKGKTITLTPFRFNPRIYKVKVNLNGQPAPDGMLRVWFVKSGETPVMRSEIQISGADVRTPLHWAVKATADGGWIEALDTIYPYEAIDADKAVELATVAWPFTVKAGDVRSGNLRVELGRGLRLSFPFTGNREGQISITVPKGEYSSKDFLFSADDALVSEADGVVTIEPKPEIYVLKIPGAEKFWDGRILGWDWDFEVSGTSCRRKDNMITLPSGIKLGNCRGILTINGERYAYVEDNGIITPKATVIKTTSQAEIKAGIETFNLNTNGTYIFPGDFRFELSDSCKDDLVIEDKEIDSVKVVDIVAGKDRSNVHNGGGSDTPSKKGPIPVTFVNCKGFVIASDNGKTSKSKGKTSESKGEITKSQETITMTSEIVWISKNGKICTIFRDGSKYTDKVKAENEACGFEVRYMPGGCKVTYNGKSGFDLPKKWIVAGAVLLATIAVAVVAWFVLPWGEWFGKNTAAPIAQISFVPDSKSEYFSDNNAVIEKIAPATTLLAVKDDSIIQVMYDSKFLKKNCKGKIGVYIDSILREVVSLKIDGVQIADYNLDDSSIRQSLFKQISDYEAMLESNGKPISLKSLYIAVNSPVRDAVKTFANEQANSTKEILFSRAKDIMHNNPATAAPIMAICWERLEADHTAENIANFREAFGTVEGFDDHQALLDEWSANIANEAKKAADLNALITNATAQRSKLWAKTCTKNTVDNVNNWWQSLPANDKTTCINNRLNLGAYVAAYNEFFKVKNKNDIHNVVTKYKAMFSPYQYNVLSTFYDEDGNKFKKRSKAYGLTFVLPESEVNPQTGKRVE